MNSSILLNVALISLFYGIIYSQMKPGSFNFKSPVDPFYFALTTMSSVGYGEITPQTDVAKMLVMSQQLALMGEIASSFKII